MVSVGRHKFFSEEEMQSFVDKCEAKGLTTDGSEMPDPRPMQPPVGYVKQPSMFDVMRAQVAAELARRRIDQEQETPEDAADMGDDDEDMVERLTQYETYDLEMELARRVDAEKKAAPPPSSDVPTAPPGAPPAAPPADGPGAPVSKPEVPLRASGKSQ